jgi:hypothetical protein
MTRSTQEVIHDEKLGYPQVVEYLGYLINYYIKCNDGNRSHAKKCFIKYLVKNTDDKKPITADEIMDYFKSLEQENIEKLLGLPSSDPEANIYLEVKDEILKDPRRTPNILSGISNRLGFIGQKKIRGKNAYFFKTRRAQDFEKRFRDEAPDKRNLKKVILNLLENHNEVLCSR